MKIQRIPQEDLPQAALCAQVAFTLHEDGNWFETPNAWGAYEDNTVVAAMMEHCFDIRLHGHWVPSTGIGGVCSRPEFRRNGAIRGIFTKMLPEARERGVLWSGLFPFSHAFYGKFGYRLSAASKKVTLPLEPLLQYPQPAKVVMFNPGEKKDEVDAVYRAFAADLQLPGDRPRPMGAPVIAGQYRYMFYDAAGKPEAYIVCENVGGNFVLHQYAYVNRQALMEILGYAGRFYPHHQHLQMTIPSDLPVAYWVDPYQCKIETGHGYMGRVVNVPKMLELLPWSGEGKVAIQVADDFLADNNATFQVEFGGGEAKVTTTSASPDLAVNVRTLAPMCCGGMSLEQALWLPGTELHGKKDLLAPAFAPKSQFVCDGY